MEEISRIVIALLLREPFYAHVLMGVNKVFVENDPLVPTLGLAMTEKGPVLYLNAAFWESLFIQPEHRIGLLKHEVLHLLFRHSLIHEPNLDSRLVDIAMDLAVNQYVDPDALPEDSLFLHTFPEWELKPGQTWRYYYDRLEKLSKRPEHANTVPLSNLMAIAPDTNGLERHLVWKKGAKRSSSEKEIQELLLVGFFRRIGEQLPDATLAMLPQTLHSYLAMGTVAPSAMNWRLALRIFAESSSKTRLRHTINRPSKRYGTRPGVKIARQKRLLVAIDTSGSITKEDRAVFFNELHYIWRRGAHIEVVECDEIIHATWNYEGQSREHAGGGGGTDFNAPIRYGNEEVRPDGLIYFTDGLGSAPVVKPTFPLLWVIGPKGVSRESTAFMRLPGRRVKLEK